MTDEIRPFRIEIPQAEIDDHRRSSRVDTMPGEGVLLAQVGRIVRDAGRNILFIAGQFDVFGATTNTTAFRDAAELRGVRSCGSGHCAAHALATSRLWPRMLPPVVVHRRTTRARRTSADTRGRELS